jgi:hypothetical protein
VTVFATVVVAAGVAMVWVRVVQTLTDSSGGPKTVGQPGALVWDGRVFTTADQLKAYLTSRGLSYARWRALHPTAFGAPAPAVTTHTTTAATKTVKKTTTVRHVATPALSDKQSRPTTSVLLLILMLVGGLAIGGSAALPPRFVPASVQNFYASPDRRLIALAAAAAILLGFAVSFLLT